MLLVVSRAVELLKLRVHMIKYLADEGSAHRICKEALVSMSLAIGVLVSNYRCHLTRGSLGIDVILRDEVLAVTQLRSSCFF